MLRKPWFDGERHALHGEELAVVDVEVVDFDAAENEEAVAPPHATPAAARAHLTSLFDAKRALAVTIAGEERYAAIEDASRLRDALGVPLPIGVPVAFIEPVDDPLGDLVSHYARILKAAHAIAEVLFPAAEGGQ